MTIAKNTPQHTLGEWQIDVNDLTHEATVVYSQSFSGVVPNLVLTVIGRATAL